MAEQNEYLRATRQRRALRLPHPPIEVTFNEPTLVIVRDDRRKGSYDLQVLLAVLTGKTTAGRTGKKSFAFKVTGEIDKNPVEITLDASHPGQLFDGLGGNFRLQNPRTDRKSSTTPSDNLRVAWGRVEMPWSLWQPDEDTDPLAAARAGNVIRECSRPWRWPAGWRRKECPSSSAPGPPRLGGPRRVGRSRWVRRRRSAGCRPGGRPGRGLPAAAARGPRGNPLNPEKMARIKDSIAGYLLFLKEKYGVEAALFSFNESDIGINVRQTPREHAELIKTLGAWFAAKGLATKLALGDTSDANPIDFIQPALHDPEAGQVHWRSRFPFLARMHRREYSPSGATPPAS